MINLAPPSPTTFCFLLGIAAALYLPAPIAAQPFSGPSYADVFNENYAQTGRPRMNPRTYTYDRYLYHDPNVSPYLNLTRRTSAYTNPYRAYVEPEIKRRDAMQSASPFNPPPSSSQFSSPSTGSPFHSPTPATRSPYYNHWYGSGVVPR